MPPFRQILCPVDFSVHSRRALRYAAALAARARGKLTVLFVADPLLNAAVAAAAYDVNALSARTEAELRRFVTSTLGANAPTATIATAVGHVAPEIAKMAGRIGADLIVMGSRGLTGVGKWFFGSTTAQMLRKSAVPILVVPSKRRAQSAMRAWPGKRVLVPVDLEDYAAVDVKSAIDVAHGLDATAVLVHALPPVNFPSWLHMDTRAYNRDRMAIARQRLVELAASDRAEYDVAVGDVVGVIARSAARTNADLILLTTKHASDPLGPRRGTIAYRILAAGVAPILAIPASTKSP
jgi:nucleotide-binding universal stress UspA family protein